MSEVPLCTGAGAAVHSRECTSHLWKCYPFHLLKCYPSHLLKFYPSQILKCYPLHRLADFDIAVDAPLPRTARWPRRVRDLVFAEM